MKNVKRILILVLISISICSGCGNKNTNKTNQIEKELITNINNEKETKIEKKVKENNITINLHHVIFDEKYIIVEYTLEAQNVEDYIDIVVNCISKEIEIEEINSVIVESKKNKERKISYIRLKNGTLSKNDVGKKVEIQFYSSTGIIVLGEEGSINIPVEITKVYTPEHIKVEKEINYNEGKVLIESVDISRFYTDINYNAYTKNFMMDLYGFEVKEKEKNTLQMMFGNEHTYSYFPIQKNIEELETTVIQYKKQNDYEKRGKGIDIRLNE